MTSLNIDKAHVCVYLCIYKNPLILNIGKRSKKVQKCFEKDINILNEDPWIAN